MVGIQPIFRLRHRKVHVPEEEITYEGVLLVGQTDRTSDVISLLLQRNKVPKLIARGNIWGCPPILGDPDLLIIHPILFHPGAYILNMTEVVGGMVVPAAIRCRLTADDIARIIGPEGIGGVRRTTGMDCLNIEVVAHLTTIVGVHGPVELLIGEGDRRVRHTTR